MPGVVRLTDLSSRHAPNMTASNDTIVNGRPVVRFNDLRSHPPYYYYGGRNVGVHDVYINNRWVQTCGDPIDRGGIQVQGSNDTIVN